MQKVADSLLNFFGNLTSIEWWRNVFTKHGQKFVWGLTIVMGLSIVISFGAGQYAGRARDVGTPASQNAVVATVNGEPISQAEFASLAQQSRGTPGEQFAESQGQVANELITLKVLEQEAKKLNIRPSDADVDKAVQEMRDRMLPKGASDADWEQRLDAVGKTPEDFRQDISRNLLPQALMKYYADNEKVTEDEAKNTVGEVHLSLVLIPTAGGMMRPTTKVLPLPDAEAKKKADDLLAKARGGADIAALARENSGDASAKTGGDLNWRPEYSANPSPFGALGYGKDFDDAVHKTVKGQFTDVIKATGFNSGYVFAKVVDRRTNLPKDFDIKKVTEQLKQQRGQQKLRDLIRAQVKAAKVEFKDPDKKAFYDYAKLKQGEQAKMMAQFGGADAADVPTTEEQQKLQTTVDTEFEDMLKRHPDDATAALVVAEALKKKRFANPAQSDQIRDRLISLYETALKTTEDRQIRFELADLYRDKKQTDKAAEQYTKIARLLDADPPYDQQSMQTALSTYQRLEASFKSVDKPTDAAQMKTNADKVKTQLDAETKKQAEEQKKQAEAAKAASKSAPPPLNLNPPTNGVPATNSAPPGPSAVQPGDKAPASNAPAPTGGKPK